MADFERTDSRAYRAIRCRFCRRKTTNMFLNTPKTSVVVDELSLMPLAGLNQAFAAESRRVGFIWGVLFAMAVVVLIYHFQVIVKRFYKDPVSTEIEVRATNFKFPNLYICNPLVISMSLVKKMEVKDIKIVDKYQKNVQKWAKVFIKVREGIEMSSRTNAAFRAKWLGPSQRLNVSGMLSSFDAIDSPLKLFAAPASQTLIHADIDGRILPLSAFEVVPSNKFFSCLKFMNGSLLKSPENKLTLYLYADASWSPTYRPKELNDLIGVTYEGVRQSYATSSMELFFVQENMYPDATAHQVTAACGANTRINVIMTEIKTSNRKKRQCKESARTVSLANHLKPSTPVKNILDHASCVSYGTAKEINSSCKCFPLDSPLPSGVIEPNFCINSSHFSAEEIIKNVECVDEIQQDGSKSKELEDDCEKEQPCGTLIYQVSSAASRWPTEKLAGKFIKNIFIKTSAKRENDSKLEVYAWNNVLHETGASQLNMLRENVAKIEIRPLESKSTKMTETPAYTVYALLSDIGGILGLYVGASLLSICEVIQTCFMIVVIFIKQLMNKHTDLRVNV